jgi:hypothetical protein
LKIKKLKEEIINLKEHLKKYTNPARNKKYYETHKEELKKEIIKNQHLHQNNEKYGINNIMRRKN